jgi:hypothetical protein
MYLLYILEDLEVRMDIKEINNQFQEIIIKLVVQVGLIKEHLIYLLLIMEYLIGDKFMFHYLMDKLNK